MKVMYAGECGEQGLDMEDLLTREGEYDATNPDGNECYMNFPVPFKPETKFYKVVSIEEGNYLYHFSGP